MALSIRSWGVALARAGVDQNAKSPTMIDITTRFRKNILLVPIGITPYTGSHKVYHTGGVTGVEKGVKVMPEVIGWLEEQGLLKMFETLPEQLELPMLAGRFDEGDITVEAVGEQFCRLFEISRPKKALLAEELFEGKVYPLNLEPFRQALKKEGWSRNNWDIIPGEKEISCICCCDAKGYFFAAIEDRTEQVINCRLFEVRDRMLEMMELYEARDLITEILKETITLLDVDWNGVFLWDDAQGRWMLSMDKAKDTLGSSSSQSLLTFALELAETPDGPVPYAFGELEISEGNRWTIPWKENAGKWKSFMKAAGVGSLSAGVLLTGRTPAVLVSLSRRSGGFARINGEVLKTFWPVMISLFERNRAVEGIASLYPRDPVTGLYASSMFKRIVSTEMDRSRRYGYPLSFIVLKVSNMKDLVKKGGSKIEDETIRIIARQVLGSVRNVDIAGRLDDSVLLLMPHTPLEGAQKVADRLKESMKSLSPVPDLSLDTKTQLAVFHEGLFEPEDFLAWIGL